MDRRLLIVAALLAACCAAPSGAATYWVDREHPQAADDNAGTDPAGPWKTLLPAMRKAGAGDTVWVGSGHYPESNAEFYGRKALRPRHGGTAEAPLAFRVAPGQSAVLEVWISLNSHNDHNVWDGFLMAEGQGINVTATGQDRNEGTVIENCEVGVGGTEDGPGNHYDVMFAFADEPVVRNCLLRDVFYTDSDGPASGVLLYNTRGGVIEHNEFRDSGCGIYDKAAGEGNIFRYNYIHDMENCGILVAGYRCERPGVECGGQQIYQNVVTGSRLGMKLGGGESRFTDLHVWNNTVAGVGQGILLGETPGIRMWNNIVEARELSLALRGSIENLALSDFSIYHPARFSVRAKMTRSVDRRGLLSWRRHTGLDEHSQDVDPGFVDPEQGDFRLVEDSPARGGGRAGGAADGEAVPQGAYVAGDERIGAVDPAGGR